MYIREDNKYIKAEPGFILRRKSDKHSPGTFVYLGLTWYIGGVKLAEPLMELPEHYEEIEATEEELPVEIPTEYLEINRLTKEELIEEISAKINKIVNNNILRTFRWRDYEVWLTAENQLNYKTVYDLSFQAQVMNQEFTPVKFKFGSSINPVYHTFTSFEELAEFYIQAIFFVQSCYQWGWDEKDKLTSLTKDELTSKYFVYES